MNRRSFLATLAAPFVARFMPKKEFSVLVRGLPSPDGRDYVWLPPGHTYSGSPIADIERAMLRVREGTNFNPPPIVFVGPREFERRLGRLR